MGRRGPQPKWPLLRHISERGRNINDVAAESGMSANRIRTAARGCSRLSMDEAVRLYKAIEGRLPNA